MVCSQQCIEDFMDQLWVYCTALNNVYNISLTYDVFSGPAINIVWKILLTCDVCQEYQWNMLLGGKLAQVSEILQTLWRPREKKPFIFIQTLYSGGQRGYQRLSQEWDTLSRRQRQGVGFPKLGKGCSE